MLNKKRFITALIIVILSTLFLSTFGDAGSVYAHELPEDISFDFSVTIYVGTLDFSKKKASLSIYITIRKCTYPNATVITVIFEGDAYPFVKCANIGEGAYYGTEAIDWPLFGFGESYPFDSYKLQFKISRSFYFEERNHIHFLKPNATLLEVYSPWGVKTVEPSSEFYIAEFFIDIERSSFMPFYQLLLPILLCCFMLGGSLIIDRGKLAIRMRVYLSLFVFAPTFLFAIQSYLPYRLSLCIPEILLVSVLSSTAIFSFSSMIPLENTMTAVAGILDFLAQIVSIVLLIILFQGVLPLKDSLEIPAVLIVAIVGFSTGMILRFLRSIYRRFHKGIQKTNTNRFVFE